VNHRIQATVPVSIQAAEGDGKRRFTLTAYTGEPMQLGWWPHPVVVDCATLNATQQRIPCLLDHSASEDCIVGQVEAISVGNGGLPPILASGVFTPTADDDDAARRVLAKSDAGFQWQVSIGGEPSTMEEVKAGAKVQVNGREYVGPVFIARGVVLREISFVVLGADRKTSAVVASHKGNAMKKTFEEWLAAQGFTVEALTATQSDNMKRIYAEYAEEEEKVEGEDDMKEEDPPVEGMDDDEEKVEGMDEEEEKKEPVKSKAKNSKLQAQLADAKREAGVAKVLLRCGNPKITVNARVASAEEHAARLKWDARETELQILRASRAKGPNVFVKNSRPGVQALEGAMLLRCGGKLDSKAYGDINAVGLIPSWLRAGINDATRNQLMEQAHSLAKMSAIDIARESLRANGKDVPHDRDEMLKAAFSSGSLTNSMTTSMNAILLSTYLESTDTTQGWVREGEIPNYLTAERVRVLKGDSLEELPEDGEADHSTISDTAESYKIKRFAKQFVIDEIAFINDTLGALKQKPVELGLAAARLRPDLVYATIMSNPTLAATSRELFNSTDANLITSSALARGTLATALARMSVIQENGVNIDVEPTHLIVPPSLRETASSLTGSQNLITGENATMGEKNTLTEWGLIPVGEKRLENGVRHPSTKVLQSGSASTWYLAAKNAPALEVGYLRGQRVPQVRSGTLDKGRYGMWWDVQMSVGVCPLDWKGMLKATG